MRKTYLTGIMVLVAIFLMASFALAADYNQAPELQEMVENDELEPVAERLPKDPMVVEPHEEIGQYGGTIYQPVDDEWEVSFLLKAYYNYNSLIRWSHNAEKIIPNLAKDWEVSDGGRVFTFYLREGIKWSDGVEWNADDIMFWWEDILNNKEMTPEMRSLYKHGGETAKLEKIDDYTIQFIFPEPHGTFLEELASENWYLQSYPAHYLKQFHPKYADKDKIEEMAQEEGFETWYEYLGNQTDERFIDMPTLGPWKSYVEPPAQIYKFERNPYYWKVDSEGNQLPYVDEFHFEVVEDSQMLVMKTIAGEVDFIGRGLSATDLPVLMEAEKEGKIEVVRANPDTMYGLMFNMNHPEENKRKLFQDKRFRYAVSHALDRDEINSLVYIGAMNNLQQIGPYPNSPYYNEELATSYIENDIEKANQYLDEMGLTEWTEDGKYRLGFDGERIDVNFDYPIQEGWDEVAELMKDYLSEIGIRLNLNSMDRTLLQQRMQNSETDISIWMFAGVLNPNLAIHSFAPLTTAEHRFTAGSWNEYGRWYITNGSNGEEPPAEIKEIYTILDELSVTVEEEEKIKLWNRIFEIHADQLYNVGIGSRPVVPIAHNPKLKNVPDDMLASWVYKSPTGGAEIAQFFFDE